MWACPMPDIIPDRGWNSYQREICLCFIFNNGCLGKKKKRIENKCLNNIGDDESLVPLS